MIPTRLAFRSSRGADRHGWSLATGMLEAVQGLTGSPQQT
jgi:hypothetical protein